MPTICSFIHFTLLFVLDRWCNPPILNLSLSQVLKVEIPLANLLWNFVYDITRIAIKRHSLCNTRHRGIKPKFLTGFNECLAIDLVAIVATHVWVQECSGNVHGPTKIDKRRIFFNLLEVFADREQTFNRDIRLRILLQSRSHLLIFSVLSVFRLFICFDIDLK